MDTSADFDGLFDQHVQRLQRDYAAAMDASGHAGVIVASGAPAYRFEDDQTVSFRVNPRYRQWIPAGEHSHSFLVIRPGQRPLMICHQPRDYWHVVPAPPSGFWTACFDIECVASAEAAIAALPAERAEMAWLGEFSEPPAGADPPALNPPALTAWLDYHRVYKTEYEIACLGRASSIAARAHLAARDVWRAGGSEFDIHLAYQREAGQNEQQLPYSNIVAVNEHGATLHYDVFDHSAPPAAHSFLIDAGAVCNGYAADITRTWPAAEGLFADLVSSLDHAQRELVAGIRPGQAYLDLHLQAHDDIADILAQLGLVEMDPESMVESGVTSAFFPHGLGHHLGLQVHDRGGKLADPAGALIPQPADHPFLRNLRPIEPGNVFTIEPGIYVIEQLLAPLRERVEGRSVNWDRVAEIAPCGGVRIEDNIIVTIAGVQNLTRDAFARIESG
ncbi:MAG: Xaa-Pro dipeptidase [Gammaproteobacteria bacterium]